MPRFPIEEFSALRREAKEKFDREGLTGCSFVIRLSASNTVLVSFYCSHIYLDKKPGRDGLVWEIIK